MAGQAQFHIFFPEELVIKVQGASISWPQARRWMWKQGFSDINPEGVTLTLTSMVKAGPGVGAVCILHWQTTIALVCCSAPPTPVQEWLTRNQNDQFVSSLLSLTQPSNPPTCPPTEGVKK